MAKEKEPRLTKRWVFVLVRGFLIIGIFGNLFYLAIAIYNSIKDPFGFFLVVPYALLIYLGVYIPYVAISYYLEKH